MANSKGLSGNNVITGGSGNDKINGGANSDTLDGGAGNDTVNGDSGDDILIYGLAENGSATDVYTGGSGIDTVRIDLTQAEWMNAAVEYQLARYYQHLLTVKTNPKTGEVSNGSARDFTFDFGNGSKLTVQMMERLEITVDGVIITNQDQPVIKSAPQSADVVEDGDSDASPSTAQSANGSIDFFDIDLNDSHVVSVVTPLGAYGVLSANVSNPTLGDSQGAVAWSYQLDNAAIQFLAAGEQRTEVFTIRIADSDNSANFAETQVTITITGTNDAPIITAEDLIGGVTELVTPTGNLTDSGSISFSDVDLTDVHLVSAVGTAVGSALGSLSAVKDSDTTGSGNGGQLTWTYSVAAGAVEYLAAGQTKVESFTISLDDQKGGVITKQIDVTITGTNDAPIITAEDLIGGVTELVTPAGNLTDSGSISFSDVDLTDVHLVSAAGTPVGTTLGNLSAVKDSDTTGSGTGGQLTWTYSVAAGAVEYLAAGQSKVESFTISLNDQNGGVITKQIDVTITGTNDTPIITAEDLVGGVTELVTPAGNLTDSGTISFSDVDLTDVHLVSATGTPVGTTLGNLSAVKDSDTTGSGNGGQLTWTYSVAAGAVEYLAAGQTKVESFTISLDDQNGGVISKQIDVTITGTNDAPVIQGGSDGIGAVTATTPSVFTVQQFLGYRSTSLTDLENYAASNAASYTVTTNVIDYTDDPSGFAGLIPGSSPWPAALATGTTGTGATINDNFFARITGQLRVDATDTFTFRTYNDDGVFVKVNNQLVINDPGIHGEQEYSGNITLNPGVYPIELFFFEYGGEASLEFSYRSSGSSFGLDLDVLRDNGAILFNDVDLTDAHTVSIAPVGSNLGSLTAIKTVDTTGSGTGGQVKWDYSVNNDAVLYLGEGVTKVESFIVTVDDGKGGTATQQVDVTITGINDPAVLGNAVVDIIETDSPLTTGGTLSITDPDAGQAFFVAQNNTAGTYGSFSIDANGVWSYNSNDALDAFAEGQVETEVFNVTSVDGTATTVTVNITGTADGPTAVDDSNSLTASTPAQNTGNTVYWVDWQSITAIPGNAFGEVNVAGTITLPDRTIDVTYTGQIYATETYISPSNTQNYWHSSQDNGATWLQNGDGVYTSNEIANGPGSTNYDFIALALANTPRNVSFSEPVANLFFAVASMNNNGYLFDQPFTVVSSADSANDRGNWGHTSGITLSSNNGQYGISTAGFSPNEFHGVLAINNAVDSLTWESQSVEYYQGFTVGTYGVAQSATSSGNVLTNDLPDTGSPVLEVSVAGGQTMVGNSVTLTLASGAILRVDRDGDYLYNDNGEFAYLTSGQSFVENVEYTVKDNQGNIDTATLSITVNGVDDAAVLGSATVNLIETDAQLSTGGTLSITDPDAGQAFFNAQSGIAGTYGSFSIDANGVWSYNANGALDYLAVGQNVADVFNVTSVDGTATTVTVNIAGSNDAPTANTNTVTVQEDQSISINVLANDTDPDSGDTLTINATSTASNGSVAIMGNNIAYTPNANYAGLDSFTYTVKDNFGATSTATVNVTVQPVNDAPKINYQKATIVNGSFENSTTGWTASETNYIGDWQAANGSKLLDMNAENGGGSVEQTLQTIIGTQYTVGFALSKNPGSPGGTETLRVTAAGNTQDYVFNSSNSTSNMQWADKTFTFTATNTTTILRLASADPFGNGDAHGPALDNVRLLADFSVNEDIATVVKGLSITDIDSGNSPITVSLSVTNGTLSIAGAGLSGDLNGSDGTLAITGTLANINAALAGSLVYQGKLDYFGADALSISVNDLGATGAGGALTDTKSISIDVRPMADTYVISNLVTNGSFEGSTTGWAASQINHLTGWQAADGTWSLDMNAEAGGGYVQQTLQTVAGQQYTVGFALSKNPGSPAGTETLRVSAAGSSQDYVFNSSNNNTDMKWTQKTFTFTAVGSTTDLKLAGTDPAGSDAHGPALDEVLASNNSIITGFDKVLGDKIDLNSFLTSVNAPHNSTAFSNGFLDFLASGSDTIVRIDADGGGDNYINVATIVGVSLLTTDTGNYML